MRGRSYLLFALAYALANGLVVGGVCWLVGLPAAISLGVAVAAMSILPLVGGIPAMLLAFGLEGWPTGALVSALLVALQVVEVALVRPWVDARAVRVGPTVPIVVALLGVELYGVGGSIYGLALAVIALAALDVVGHLRGEPPTDGPETLAA